MNPAYAGIGARATPPDILSVMRGIARVLAKDGFLCQTGAAKGADQAFAEGALCGGGEVALMLPWDSYEQEWINNLVGSFSVRVLANTDKLAYMSVNEHHPSFERLSQGAKRLHARNWLILQDIKFVICWTPGGKGQGGTGQGIRIARQAGAEIHDLGNPSVLKHFIDKLIELGEM